MARWRLRNPHYLNVPGTEWEYKETDQTTGKQGRKIFQVPLLLDTNNPADCNYPGEIIVCHKGKGQGRDIVFVGQPTPDMEPLDDEATAISEKESPKWIKPIERIDGVADYSQSLIASFERQMTEVIKQQALPNTAVARSEIDELKAQVKALTAQLQKKVA